MKYITLKLYSIYKLCRLIKPIDTIYNF